MKKFTTKFMTVSLLFGTIIFGTSVNVSNTYAGGLEGSFPSDYKTKLESLSKSYPNWTFKSVDTGLKWDDVIAAESTKNKSLISKSYSELLLSRASGDYDADKGKYIAKDGSSWVSASRAAVSYYIDPRNFLSKDYMFMFEAQDFNASFHTLDGVEAILSGTDLHKKTIKYVDTSGKSKTMDLTYGEAIFNAGKGAGVSPLALASRIKQETGGDLSNNSISGTYSYDGVSYKGYYNFYNIGASATATGSAVANGLKYAKSKGWTDPVKAIEGGVDFLATSYINKGQNTGYFQKFNVVYKPYYGHQYMQNLTAAATEGATTYTAYNDLGIASKGYIFYIPVYDNMPSLSSKVTITKNVKTGKIINVTNSVNMRSKPSTNGKIVKSVPKNAKVTLDGAVYTDATAIYTQLANPYWFKVTYDGKTGYISSEYINVDNETKLLSGTSKQLSTKSGSGEKIYYETSNPAVATVNASGKITAKGSGDCDIYAISSSGQTLDAIGIETYANLTKPVLGAVSNVSTGLCVTWTKVTGATGYRIYRKESSGWKLIQSITKGSTLSYIDKTAVAGKKYTYTVRAYNNYVTSGYDATGKTYMRIATPSISSISTSTNAATVKWNKVTGATGYHIYRRKNSNSWAKVGTVSNGSTVQYADKNLLSGTKYSYAIVAYNGSYTSYRDTTGVASYTTPDKVTLKSLSNSEGGVTIKWNKVSAGDGYRIYRKLSTDKSWTKIATVKSISTSSYKDKKAISNKKYIYTVRAYKDSKAGAYDKAGKSILYLASPSLKIASTSASSVKIKWSKVAGAKGYYVYRKASNGSWKKIATIKKGTTVNYNNKSLKANTTYYYTVKAYTGKINSGYDSDGIKGKTKVSYATYKTTTKVNYRSGAGTKYKVAGTLAKNKKISIEKGYSKKSNGYTWYRFKIKNKNYYIASKYVKK